MEPRYCWMAWKYKKGGKKSPSNCRPAGLPAKSSEEELRHQRQYQKLVEEARRKEQEDNRCEHCNWIWTFQKYCSHLWSLPGRGQERLPIKGALRTISLPWLVIGPTRFCQVFNRSQSISETGSGWWLIFIILIFFSPQTGSESGNQGKRKVFGGEVCNLWINKLKMLDIHCNLSIYKFKNLKCS